VLPVFKRLVYYECNRSKFSIVFTSNFQVSTSIRSNGNFNLIVSLEAYFCVISNSESQKGKRSTLLFNFKIVYGTLHDCYLIQRKHPLTSHLQSGAIKRRWGNEVIQSKPSSSSSPFLLRKKCWFFILDGVVLEKKCRISRSKLGGQVDLYQQKSIRCT
jgi:hypothetical protein